MTEPTPPLAPSAILETGLYASDLAAAERFYGTLLGLEIVQKVEGRHVFFRVGAAMLLVFNPDASEIPSRNSRLPVPPHGARGPGHMCFAMPRPEIENMRNHLINNGFEIEAQFDWPNGARSLYTRDPAGNSVEFAEPWLWSADEG